LKHSIINEISLILVSFVVVFFFSAPKVLAMTPEEVLAKFETRFKGLKKYKVETVENSKTIGPKGMEESRSNGVTWVKGKKRYSEITIIRNKNIGKNKSVPQEENRNRILQVFDGTISWLYDKSKKEVKKVDFSKLPASIQEKIKASQDNTDLKLPEGLEFKLEEKILQVKKDNKKKFYVLTSTNTVTIGGQKYDKIILWIDAKLYLPSKVETYGKIIIKIPQTRNLEIQTQICREFKNWEIDVDIPGGKFAFKVPEGIKVIEATDKTKVLYEKYLKNH